MRCATAQAFEDYYLHRPGSYVLRGSKSDKHRRLSRAFEYENDPQQWTDQRTVVCETLLRTGDLCNSKFSLLSENHLEEEVQRLANMNGVLEGASCGCCGRRYLDAPEQFVLHGTHKRLRDKKGNPLKPPKRPQAVRVIHKPCKGKPGARFTISVAHRRQRTTKDNVRILHSLLNSAGILDLQRMLGTGADDKKIGISRIYDRILWLEGVFLAYEKEMLRRWREKVERKSDSVHHRLSHDDMVVNVNWETSTDRRNTQLNCAVTADADSGYVYRIDVDFDPNAKPLELFRASFLDDQGDPVNLRKFYQQKSGEAFSAPLLSWQRPTGRFHEPQFFAACINELQVFQRKLNKRHPQDTKESREALEALNGRIQDEIHLIKSIGEDWFGFTDTSKTQRGSFQGMTTRDTYTKAAHFTLLKGMLPKGKITLTTEQESTLPNILPHLFQEEIKDGQFTWLAMTFKKNAKKSESLSKTKNYQKARKAFLENGLFDGRFSKSADPALVTKAFIAENMTVALGGPQGKPRPYPISNFQGSAFPKLWVNSPAQGSNEIDKKVGFPIVDAWLRHRLKKLPFNPKELDDELREDLAEHVWDATLQPASAFMNSVRARLEATKRTDGGGARTSGTYRMGAVFNPRVLIAILNIYRVHYNFFEMRPYVSLTNSDSEMKAAGQKASSLRYPGTDEVIEVKPIERRVAILKTPAMRHGMDAYIKDKKGRNSPPDIYRVLYRPWLYFGTPAGKKLDRSGS